MRAWQLLLVGTIGLLTTAAFSAQSLAKWYVKEKYPEIVRLNNVDWGWTVQRLRGVYVKKPGLVLDTPLVEHRKGLPYKVHGGFLTLNLTGDNLNRSPSRKPSLEIEYDNLTVDIHYQGWTAHLQGAYGDTSKIHFQKGSLNSGTRKIVLGKGSYDRRSKSLALSRVETDLKLPVLPKIPRDVRVQASDVRVNRTTQQVSAIKVSLLNKDGQAIADLTGVSTGKSDAIFIEKLDVQHPWLSSDRFTLDSLRIESPIHGGTVPTQITLSLGRAQVMLDLSSNLMSFNGPCQDWASSLGAKHSFEGGLSGSVRWGEDPDITIDQDCRVECPGLRDEIRKPFTQWVYRPDGATRYQRQAGPGSPDWTPLKSIPKFLSRFVVSMEDPGFRSHKGVHTVALVNSLKQNLDAKRFVRGGSTITMQLARNLWLKRDKTIVRKAREVLLAWAVEQCLSKDEILELYLNIVEFGPDTYGINAASIYHYGHTPVWLNATESFFLASILPSPKTSGIGRNRLSWARKRAKHFLKTGWLSPDVALLFDPPIELDESSQIQ